MDLEALLAGLVTGLELLDDVGLARRSEKRRQPVMMLDDLVRDHPCRDLARPTHHLGHPERALPFVFFSLRNGVVPASGQLFS
jgi:hypothetical protein